MKTIGITTTIPIEIPLAAGYKVIDLNNLFITSQDYNNYIDLAEKNGFPKSCCAWIKGIYGALIENNINSIINVIEGDCSNTKSLGEVLKLHNISSIPFSYPSNHEYNSLKNSIESLMEIFNVNYEEISKTKTRLDKIRKLAIDIDKLTYLENKVSGFDNHIYHVSFSDFNQDIEKFEKNLIDFFNKSNSNTPSSAKIRLGYIGVPPMTSDLYSFIEKFNSRIVYNEVQREFTFPRSIGNNDIIQQYYDYTYPYDLDFRLKEIKQQIKIRKLDGIIHYTQAFCHRAIEDIVIRQQLNIPILNIEGDKLNTLDNRTKLRLEAFLDMLGDKIVSN